MAFLSRQIIDLDFDGFVLCNGGHVEVDHHLIYEKPIPYQDVLALKNMLDSVNCEYDFETATDCYIDRKFKKFDDFFRQCDINGDKLLYDFDLEDVMKRTLKIEINAIDCKEEIERFSIIRAVAAVERCDVAILVIDANEGITDQDTKIAGIAHERGKAAIIAVNKWDSVEKDDKTMNKYLKDIGNELAYMPYAPRVFISALTGQRIPRMLELIRTVNENHALRISTGVLNEVLIEATAMQQPPADKGRQLRLYYMTQVSVKPPTFVIFVNERELFHFSYRRYIENQLREAFGFVGTPIHFIVREKGDKD